LFAEEICAEFNETSFNNFKKNNAQKYVMTQAGNSNFFLKLRKKDLEFVSLFSGNCRRKVCEFSQKSLIIRNNFFRNNFFRDDFFP